MSWLNDLYETYENCESEVGKIIEDAPVLLPIAHSTQNAQIEIVLNESGEFVRSEVIPKRNAVTIIPVTEDSGGRSSNVAPHPLNDYLEYIAGDYQVYGEQLKKEKYAPYMDLLQEWVDSGYATNQVKSVYTYVKKGTVLTDLIRVGILEAEEGRLTKRKIETIPQEKAFVRFSVESQKVLESRLYKSKEIFDSYINYYLSKQTEVALCYATGELRPCSDKHPAKIRHAADKAKLISANDSTGYTYRGRLANSSQVVSVGYEVSQKAHNALRWLIEKQKVRAGEQVIVAWSPKNVELKNPFQEIGIEDDNKQVYTGAEFANRIRNTIYERYVELEDTDNIIIMSVEAATTGRLSIPYYLSISKDVFLDRLSQWHQTCYWKLRYKKYEQPFLGTPSFIELAYAIAGDKNDKLRKQVMERILPCIVEAKNFPIDMVNAATIRAQNPFGYMGYGEWRRGISIACALIRKEHFDRKKEEWDVALDANNQNRSYLFGRLLATAEMLEKRVLYMQNVTRNTAAERFFQQFPKRPTQTWNTIFNNLRPYMTKLNLSQTNGKRHFYVRQIDTITNQFQGEDFVRRGSLDNLFLLGYCCQMEAYETYKKADEKEND